MHSTIPPHAVPFDQAHQVDLKGDLLWNRRNPVQVQWLTSELLPTQFHGHRSYTVNITLYRLDFESGEYQENALLARNVPNTGKATVSLPSTEHISTVVPVTLKISTSTGENITFAIWSSVAFFYSGNVDDMSTNLRWACSKWYLSDDLQSKANLSRPCPAVESHMSLPGSGFTEVREAADAATNLHYKSFLAFFYRGASSCYRSVEVSLKCVG